MARALRDVLEEESGAELRVEVREVGQGGSKGGWAGFRGSWGRERLEGRHWGDGYGGRG